MVKKNVKFDFRGNTCPGCLLINLPYLLWRISLIFCSGLVNSVQEIIE